MDHFQGAQCCQGGQQHRAQQFTHNGAQLQQPHALTQGQLVTICSEANKNYLLTSRDDGVVLAYKNKQDPKQVQVKSAPHPGTLATFSRALPIVSIMFWAKVDKGDKFVDQEGCKGFILVNSATGHALSHGVEAGSAVNQGKYDTNAIDNSLLWSQGRDEGHGFRTIRSVTNVTLNLDADHGDKKHGGIKEGNRLVIHNWNKQENQKWLIAPVGPED